MKALLDTNVIVDVLQQRAPWFETGQKIFLAVANNDLIGCVTAKEIADIHFFARKQFTGQDNVDEKARLIIAKIITLFDVIDTLAVDCQNALAIRNNDYEDAIMISTAIREHVDLIVTRNQEHFRNSPVPAISPDELLTMLEEENK